MPSPASRRYTHLPRLLAGCFLALSLAAPGLAAEPGEPFLVHDIDTTGEPYFEDCHVTCPPPVPQYGSLISQLTPLGDLVVFIANDRVHGFEPWVSDGTAEGTRLLADTCPGPCPEQSTGRAQIVREVLDGRLFFWVSDPEEGDGYDPWWTDGTPEGTRALTELCPEICGAWTVGSPKVFEGFLFFQARQGLPSIRLLWRTDGTPAGTQLVERCERSYLGCNELFVYRDQLFFNGVSDLLRLEDPAASPTVAWEGTVADAAPLGDRMLLAVNQNASSLWVMDGPLAEPRVVKHLGAGFHALQMTPAGGYVYFVFSRSEGAELWRSDGTAAGTVPVGGLAVGLRVDIVGLLDGFPVVRVVPRPTSLPVVPHTLWVVDPNGPAEALTHLPVQDVEVAGGHVFFSAEDEAHGRELWVSDGTGAGTRLLADIAPGPAFSSPGEVRGFAEAGDRLFFAAFHPDVDEELWALDLHPQEEPPPPPPPPPSVEWLESPEVPGFRVQVRITGGGASILGREEPACIAETLCVSGALAGRSEVFVRVVGPKPNGFLWPTLVKFSTSTVEVWIEQEATGVVRYYRLQGASPGVDVLPGLFDRMGFRP